jgi:hypothetical protein
MALSCEARCIGAKIIRIVLAIEELVLPHRWRYGLCLSKWSRGDVLELLFYHRGTWRQAKPGALG